MPERDRLILFDIDMTLINRIKLAELQNKTLAKLLGISEDEIVGAFEEYYETLNETSDFNPDDLLVFLAKKFQFSLDKLRDTFYDPHNFQQVLYPEVLSVLSKLRDLGYQLGLYSEGFEAFQKIKLQANNLLEFFDPQFSFILKRKRDRAVIKSLPEGTVIIDDRETVMLFLKEFPHVIALHLVRNLNKPEGEKTLSTLNDLLPILAGLRDASGSEQ